MRPNEVAQQGVDVPGVNELLDGYAVPAWLQTEATALCASRFAFDRIVGVGLRNCSLGLSARSTTTMRERRWTWVRARTPWNKRRSPMGKESQHMNTREAPAHDCGTS